MRNYTSAALGIFLTLAGCANQKRIIIPELYRIEQWMELDFRNIYRKPLEKRTEEIKDQEKIRKLKELEWLYKHRRIERPGVYDDNFYV